MYSRNSLCVLDPEAPKRSQFRAPLLKFQAQDGLRLCCDEPLPLPAPGARLVSPKRRPTRRVNVQMAYHDQRQWSAVSSHFPIERTLEDARGAGLPPLALHPFCISTVGPGRGGRYPAPSYWCWAWPCHLLRPRECGKK